MPELPVAPGYKQESTQENTAQYEYTSGEFARGINISERRLNSDAELMLDIDETPDPTVWDRPVASMHERPAEAVAPKTHADEIAERLGYLSDIKKVHFIADHTKAIPALRRTA